MIDFTALIGEIYLLKWSTENDCENMVRCNRCLLALQIYYSHLIVYNEINHAKTLRIQALKEKYLVLILDGVYD